MRRAGSAGYRITLIFIGLDDAQLSVSRVHARIRRGGHAVPLPDVLRRYARSIGHLSEALPLADRVFVLDNSGPRRRLLLCRENGVTRQVAASLPPWALAAIPAELRRSASPLP